jgi:hypothetical protein
MAPDGVLASWRHQRREAGHEVVDVVSIFEAERHRPVPPWVPQRKDDAVLTADAQAGQGDGWPIMAERSEAQLIPWNSRPSPQTDWLLGRATTFRRSGDAGASAPWYQTVCLPRGGTSAARRATKSLT